MSALRLLTRIEDGQDLLEYGLLIALIALVALGAVTMLGTRMNQFYWTTIGNTI